MDGRELCESAGGDRRDSYDLSGQFTYSLGLFACGASLILTSSHFDFGECRL